MGEDSPSLFKFLVTIGQCDIDKLYFNYVGISSQSESSLYIAPLSQCVKGINRYVFVRHTVFDSNSLNQLVKACSHVEELSLDLGILDLSDLDFRIDTDYKIKTLSLQRCRLNQSSKAKTMLQQFDKIISAMADSGLKLSLRTLHVRKCGVSEKEIEVLLNLKTGFNLKDLSVKE